MRFNATVSLITVLLSAPVFASNNAESSGNYKTYYEVPIDNHAMKPYATFDMPAEIKFENGGWEVYYRLPFQIVSKSDLVPTIEFHTTKKLSENEYEVAGPHTDGTCTFGEQQSRCHLFYKSMGLDAKRTIKDLEAIYSGEELAKRSELAFQFASGPEGFLVFERP